MSGITEMPVRIYNTQNAKTFSPELAASAARGRVVAPGGFCLERSWTAEISTCFVPAPLNSAPAFEQLPPWAVIPEGREHGQYKPSLRASQ